ncbi:MAG: c-type cytochrome [Planctomycetota bacterium]
MHKRLLLCALALTLCLGASGLSIMAQDMGSDEEPAEDKKEEPSKEEPKGDGIKRNDVPEEFSKLEVPDLKAQETIDAGKKTYEGKCAGCHGEAGQSDGKYSAKLDPKATKLADAGFQDAVTDHYIYWRIKTGDDGYAGEGKSKMKSFGSMKEAQVWELVAFVRSLAAPKVEILNSTEFEDLMSDLKRTNKSIGAAAHDRDAATKAGDEMVMLVPKLAGYDGNVRSGDHSGEKVRDQADWKAFVKQMQDAADAYAKHAKAEEWDKADEAKATIGETCGDCHDVYKKKRR